MRQASQSSRKPWSRYTQTVGLNLRTISITMLMVFALLPLSGTLCAITCDTAAHSESSGHHHGAAQEPTRSADFEIPQVSGPSVHPCDHDVTIQPVTTAAERPPIAIAAQPAVLLALDAFAAPPIQRLRPSQGAPPGTAPPTSTPLVLRV